MRETYSTLKDGKPVDVYVLDNIEHVQRVNATVVAVAYVSGRKVCEKFASVDQADEFMSAVVGQEIVTPKVVKKGRANG